MLVKDSVKLIVIVDHREPQGIKTLLASMNMEIIERQLPVADYVLSRDVACERKTGMDLVNSLVDNRFFSQIDQLAEAYSRPVLLLEDLPSAFERPEWERRKKQVYGALTYTALRRGISIIPTSGFEESAILINRLASWTQEEKQDPVISRNIPKKKPLEKQQVFFLEGLHDVGERKARQLLDAFGNSPYKVIKAIIESRVLYTKSGKPKGIEGPLGGLKGIGPKFILKNKELLGVLGEEHA